MSFFLILGLVLSAAIGVSLGLIGGGGSIITVPVLVYVIGVSAHDAVAMSLAVVGTTSLVGTVLHSREGKVDFRTGAVFAVSGILSAYFGSHLTHLLSAGALLLTFAGLMLVVSVLMLYRKQRSEEGEHRERRRLWKEISAGAGVGLLTGFLGVGGGFLIVPALVLFGGLSLKKAIGTSLLVIAVNCASGLAGHLRQGMFDLRIAALVTLMAAGGSIAGTFLSHRTHPGRLRTVFALFVIGVALFLIAKNYGILFSMSQSYLHPGTVFFPTQIV